MKYFMKYQENIDKNFQKIYEAAFCKPQPKQFQLIQETMWKKDAQTTTEMCLI